MDAPRPTLGEPFDSYARLLLAADDAARRETACRTFGDADGAAKAAFEREALGAELEAMKRHHVAALLMALRWLAEVQPEHPLARVAELPRDVAELEDAVLALEGRVR
jgi:hypothetical protein